MDSVRLTIRNYRSIPFDNPISLEIQRGITFILGVNNIGKSNLLRFFYEFRQLKDYASYSTSNQITVSMPDNIPISQVLNQKNYSKALEFKFESDEVVYELKFNAPDKTYNTVHFFGNCLKSNSKINRFDIVELGLFYEILSNSLYIGSFRNGSFKTSGNYYDIQIGTQFITTWDDWANGRDILKRNKITDLIAELKELFDFEKFEISVNPEKTRLIIKNEEGSFYLDELGGGISHFIIVLGNALIQEPSFILIDEPENALHPKLQQTFVTALASKAKYGLIATSHSIGLARSVADNIYHLAKDDSTKKLSLVDFGKSYKPGLLGSINELGYSQFAEIGGNNILLVEGRTDIKSFKEILRKYRIEHHFILMDLGGSSNINGNSFEELHELKRLNAKSYNVIIDSEISQEGGVLKKGINDFIANCKKLNFNCFTTEVHSTENYLSQKAIDSILGASFTALGKYESLESEERKNMKTKWGKSDNWKVFKAMTLEDFADTKLDHFIKTTLIPNTK